MKQQLHVEYYYVSWLDVYMIIIPISQERFTLWSILQFVYSQFQSRICLLDNVICEQEYASMTMSIMHGSKAQILALP